MASRPNSVASAVPISAASTTGTSPPPPPTGSTRTDRRRNATLYDAVAGRVSAAGFIPDAPHLGRAKISHQAVTPEAVLFRRKNAPVRYHEDDFYWAQEGLPPNSLPDSDLLKAIHTYASDFYSRALPSSNSDWRSLDETALLALGILLEESCCHALGKTGDFAFTEGALPDDEAEGQSCATKQSRDQLPA